MSKTIITYLNYESDITDSVRFEETDSKSMTIPDQAISIEELAQNYTRKAIALMPSFEGIYYGDEEAPNITAMDAVDRIQYANELKAWIQETESELTQAQKELTSEKKPLQEAKADLDKLTSIPPEDQPPE